VKRWKDQNERAVSKRERERERERESEEGGRGKGERRVERSERDGRQNEKRETRGPGSILHTVSTGQQGHRAKEL
jgi:hypothetical protein